MQCPKCREENPQTAQFCRKCHTPLRYSCPNCKHVQTHGGTCEQCGLDFAKYATVLQFQVKAQAKQERERGKARNEWIKQILLLPITGGFSLIKFIRTRLLGE